MQTLEHITQTQLPSGLLPPTSVESLTGDPLLPDVLEIQK